MENAAKDAKFQKLVQILVVLSALAAGFSGGLTVPIPEDPPLVPCQCDEVVPDPEPEPKPEATDPDGTSPIGLG
jgi:hypothetical protein